MSGLDGLGWPNPENEPKPKKTMNSQLEIKLAPTPTNETMNPEQQRIAIAQACGWKWQSKMKGSIKVWANGLDYVFYDSELPDYLNDLNAMHEAEKILDANQWDSYRKNLAREWTTNDDDGMWAAINTTAAQRAEAFLRTLNLWKP